MVGRHDTSYCRRGPVNRGENGKLQLRNTCGSVASSSTLRHPLSLSSRSCTSEYEEEVIQGQVVMMLALCGHDVRFVDPELTVMVWEVRIVHAEKVWMRGRGWIHPCQGVSCLCPCSYN